MTETESFVREAGGFFEAVFPNYVSRFASREGAQAAVGARKAGGNGIGNHNRLALSRMSRNPNTRANSSRT